MSSKCPQCEGEIKAKEITAKYSEGQQSSHIPMKVMECQQCGEQYLEVELIKMLLNKTVGNGPSTGLPN
ncbi:YgiT-type zinc finger protein [Desulforamulus ferrireducens]|uniref:YgiT-type zinc finger protein n=1 Tax=Desulforamulus ferrireducens TaxID=1833852 RepID=A0A1S6IZZ6_9FIRM|nr:YgiT-type zinc finger protein [Desulforamulus ferrireducens]AQS60334.1 hypothetical protein B0537_15415 [Desulforamulus ferrireducens]